MAQATQATQTTQAPARVKPFKRKNPAIVVLLQCIPLLAASGSAEVSVVNPPPEGGTSGTVPVFVGFAVPVLESLSPAQVFAGGKEFTLSLRGRGFAPASEVYLNNSVRPPITSVGPTELKVLIASEYIADGTVIQVHVENPQPGGGLSAPVPLAVPSVAH